MGSKWTTKFLSDRLLERYFAGTLLEKVDEATMARVVYNQPGWVRRQGQYLHVLLQGYGDPEVQSAIAQASECVKHSWTTLARN